MVKVKGKRYAKWHQSNWNKMRKDHLYKYPHCLACGRKNSSWHVHHLDGTNGRTRGTFEKPGDLITLCPEDHAELHSIYSREKKNLVEGLNNLRNFSLYYVYQQRKNNKLKKVNLHKKYGLKTNGDVDVSKITYMFGSVRPDGLNYTKKHIKVFQYDINGEKVKRRKPPKLGGYGSPVDIVSDREDLSKEELDSLILREERRRKRREFYDRDRELV